MDRVAVVRSLTSALKRLESMPLPYRKHMNICNKVSFALSEIVLYGGGWEQLLRNNNIWHNKELNLYTFTNEAEQFEGYYTSYTKALSAFKKYIP